MECVGSCESPFPSSLDVLFDSLISSFIERRRRVEDKKVLIEGEYANRLHDESIREFCELSMPILMFDKNDTFIVMTLGEVRT